MPAGPLRPGRTPSLLLVLLPALLLAAFGARAVQSEVQRAQTEARTDALSAAEGLANAFARLVADMLAPLPRADARTSPTEAAEALRHLHPRFAVDDAGTVLDLDEPEPRNEGEALAAALAIAADARDRATVLLERDERIAAAALLAAAAEAVPVASVRAGLRLESAQLDTSAGESAAALRTLGTLLEQDAPLLRADWEAADEPGLPRRASVKPAAFELLFDLLLGAGDAEPAPAPGWLGAVHEGLLRDRYRLTPPVRDELAARLRVYMSEEERRAAAEAVERWEATRRPGPEAAGTEVRVTHAGALELRRRVVLEREGAATPAWIGGELPSAALAERLADVIAVTADSGVRGAALRGPSGRVLAGAALTEVEDGLRVRARVPGALLAGFAAEAAAAETAALPRSALVLAGGVLIASLALLLGASMLKRAADRNAALAEERRRFLDHVAHEIRTPASALLAMSDELAAGAVPPERRPLYHEHLSEESRRLARLVEETLDLARLEAGRLTARMEPADLVEIVRSALDEATGGEHDVTLEVPEAAVTVQADGPALRRAVRNLVENALRHGGGATPPAVAVEVADDTARVVVADSGPGIAREHLPRLFERFYRVPSDTHEAKGVGIGLALCREVAEAHGGRVEVRSEPGAGATFTLTLPLRPGGAGQYGGAA